MFIETREFDEHGVFVFLATPAPAVVPTGTGVAGMICQMPWGPKDELVRVRSSLLDDAKQIFAPRGMDRSGAGYMYMTKMQWPDIYIGRVLGAASAAASVSMGDGDLATVDDVITVKAKVIGAAGVMTATVADATDADADHFNLTITFGLTTETYTNINVSGTGPDVIPSVGSSALISAITKLDDGRPANGVYQFTAVEQLTIDAKYHGTAGNSIVAVVSNATDADPNHFNLVVTVTDAIGSTQESYTNLNISGTGDDVIPTADELEADSVLLGLFTKLGDGRPLNGTYTLSGGSNGTINLAAYTGTAGSADAGIALMEGEDRVRHLCTDYPGDSLVVGVNEALVAHVTAQKKKRIAYINGEPDMTPAEVRTDVVQYRDGTGFVAYIDGWFYSVLDEYGVQRLLPPSPLAANLACRIPASLSLAYKGTKNTAVLSQIVKTIQRPRGAGAAINTSEGIITLIQDEDGVFAFEASPSTSGPLAAEFKDLTRSRLALQLAQDLRNALRRRTDAPNVQLIRDQNRLAVGQYLNGLVSAASRDPINELHIIGWEFTSDAGLNTGQYPGQVVVPLRIVGSESISQLVFYLDLKLGSVFEPTT